MKTTSLFCAATAFSACLLTSLPTPVFAQTADSPAPSTNVSSAQNQSSNEPAWATFASDGGNVTFLAAGTLLPLITDGKDGKQHTLRTLDALLASTALATGIKMMTHEERPDGSNDMSFPSGHATAAFTVATMQAHYHPKQALLWYGGATLIGVSRVSLHRHYWHDVAAGGALGYLTARFELKQKKGLILRPFIRSQEPKNRVVGLSFSGSF